MSKPLAMCAAALAVAACTTSDSSMVSGGVGQGQVIGGVTSGVETAGKTVLSPILPSSYSNWGYTDAAGRCLVATARRGPIKLGVVLLHSPDPGKQATQLLNRGFAAER